MDMNLGAAADKFLWLNVRVNGWSFALVIKVQLQR